MGKDPAFLFYPNDYLGGTMGFTFEMHGAYLIMLLYQFNNGPFPEEIAVSMIGKLWESIQHKFKRKTGSGLRYNEKLETVTEKRKNFLTSRRESAMKRWDKKDKPLSETKIDDMRTQCIRNAHAMRMGNGNENENKDGIVIKKDNSKPSSYNEFYQFCLDHQHGEIAKNAYDGYAAADWHDSKGKQIKNWRQKMLHVWFRDENKDKKIKYEIKNDIPPPTPIEERISPDEAESAKKIVNDLCGKFSV